MDFKYFHSLPLLLLIFFDCPKFTAGISVNAEATDGNITSRNIETRQRGRGRGPCNYTHTFSNVGEFVYLESENYPNDYPPDITCSYTVNSPKGAQVRLECPASDFNIQPYQDCAKDWFYWSVSGDASPSDRVYVCGSQDISRLSTGQRLAMGFHSDGSNPSSSRPWRFRCKLTAVPRTDCYCGDSGAAVNIKDDVNTRIVGGTEALIAEFPWRVALFEQSRGIFCSGALISSSWILTAAHCTAGVKGSTIYADIGDHNVTSQFDTPNQIIVVDRYIQNSAYDSKTSDGDTALLHLSRPVQFNRFIQPLCLPWKYTFRDFQDSPATASGWGLTSFGGKLSDVLRKVTLNVINTPRCKEKWEDTDQPITQNMICASAPGRDTCQGDSGGSLDYQDPDSKRFYGIGVVSTGQACGAPNTRPAIYAQVVNFLGWIEVNTGETFCKI